MNGATQWAEVRVGDLGQVFTGRTPSTEIPEYFGNDFFFITPGDMHQRKHVHTTGRSLSNLGASLLRRIQLPPRSICVSCIGWQMGEVVMTSATSFTNQQINSIIPNGDVDADFIYYSFVPRKQELLSLASAIGVRTPILNKSGFCDLRIVLPPLPIQRKIAAILSAYDDLIENNLRRINILEEMAQNLYREWFVKFRFPGYQNARFIDSPLGMIPEGWDAQPISKIGELTVGGDWGKDEQDNVNKIQVACLRGVDLHKLQKSGETEPSLRWVKENSLNNRRVTPVDVIIEGSGECGRSINGCNELEKLLGYPVIYSNFCKRLRFKDPPIARYVTRVLNDMVATGEMHQYITGTTIPNLNIKALTENHLVLFPTVEIIQKYDEFIRLTDMYRLMGRNRNLSRTRDLLLPKLISGEVDVSELDIAVPEETGTI